MAAAPHGGYEWLRMFTPELLAQAAGDLAEAESQTRGGSGKFAARVALARAGFRFTEAWARMRLHTERGERAQAIAAGEEAIHRIRETEGSEPQAFWVSLAIEQTEAVLDPLRSARGKPDRLSEAK
jgi:hypothetical protein